MDKPQIITLGGNGLIGQRISELLLENFNIVNLSRSNGVDISDLSTLSVLKEYKANFIINFAAKADVDGCEKDKNLQEKGEAWRINTLGASNVAEVSRELGKKLIHISTDFVFNGEKPEGEEYFETDTPKPVNWYGETKFMGEKKIEESGCDYLILRPAYPYRALFEAKTDFVRAIKSRLENNLEIKAVTDHIFCPTFIDDIAQVIKLSIESDLAGIYHVVGSEKTTPYEASLLIAQVFGLNSELISKTTREEFFKGRSQRPFNLSLSNDKIKSVGVSMKGFEEGLLHVKSQLQ